MPLVALLLPAIHPIYPYKSMEIGIMATGNGNKGKKEKRNERQKKEKCLSLVATGSLPVRKVILTEKGVKSIL